MPLILAVVGEPTALGWEGADEVRVGDLGVLELAPEEGAPAPLCGGEGLVFVCEINPVNGREHTGLPVMESPRGMILMAAEGAATVDETTASTARSHDARRNPAMMLSA